MVFRVLMLLFFMVLSVVSEGQEIDNLKELKMNNIKHKYGIEGRQAPELDVPIWIDGNGEQVDVVLVWIVLVLDDIDGLVGNGTESISVALIGDGGSFGRIVLVLDILVQDVLVWVDIGCMVLL